MYIPKAFVVEDLAILHPAMKHSELATLVTTTTRGLVATHLPLILDENKGEYGTAALSSTARRGPAHA